MKYQHTQFISPTKCTVLITFEYYRHISNKFQSKGTIFRENKIPIFINQLLMESCYLYGSLVCDSLAVDDD